MSGAPSAPYTTLARPATHTEVVQGSGFLTFADRADTPEAALAQLATLRRLHPDATHHCWAYLIGPLSRFSDDGEPGGTAGAPILRAIQGRGLDHVMAVVVRHYGGTKLGTGGLARAYGGGAGECLRLAEHTLIRPRLSIQIRVPFEHTGALYQLLTHFDLERAAQDYGQSGLTLSLGLYPEDRAAFEQALADATRGVGSVKLGP